MKIDIILALKRFFQKYAADAVGGIMDEFLEDLLELMKLMFEFDHEFQKNISGFNASYAFTSVDGTIAASAIFKNGKMTVLKNATPNATLTVTFRDGEALRNFILSPDPDVLGAILSNDINTIGNLNYLFKFGYMAKYLQLKYMPSWLLKTPDLILKLLNWLSKLFYKGN